MAGRMDIPLQPGWHIKLAKHYQDGAQQRVDDAGGPATVNPYPAGTEQAIAWGAGWDSRDIDDLVVNGDFATDTVWTKGTGWTISATAIATLADTALSQAITGLVEGQAYRVTFTTTQTAGTVQLVLGGTAGVVRATSATFIEVIVAGAGADLAFLGAGFSGTIDNVTMDSTLTQRDHTAVPITAGALVP